MITIACPHKSEYDVCRIASSMANAQALSNQAACHSCTFSMGQPQATNKVTLSLALHANPRAATKLLQSYRHILESKPSLPTMATNFASAVANYIASGMKGVSAAEYESRLQICQQCEHVDNLHCRVCGCSLPNKCAMKSEHCPIGKW